MEKKIENNTIESNFLDALLLIEKEGVDMKLLPSGEKIEIKHILARELKDNARS